MLSALKEFVGIKPRSYTLSVPRIEENEGLLLLGDPGTGKSQVIHQLLDNIAKLFQLSVTPDQWIDNMNKAIGS